MPWLIGIGIGLIGGFTSSGAVKETASAGKYIATAAIVYVAYRFSKDAGWIGNDGRYNQINNRKQSADVCLFVLRV